MKYLSHCSPCKFFLTENSLVDSAREQLVEDVIVAFVGLLKRHARLLQKIYTSTELSGLESNVSRATVRHSKVIMLRETANVYMQANRTETAVKLQQRREGIGRVCFSL